MSRRFARALRNLGKVSPEMLEKRTGTPAETRRKQAERSSVSARTRLLVNPS